MSVLVSGFGLNTANRLTGGGAPVLSPPHDLPARQLYSLLRAYYKNNDLYDALAEAGYNAGIWQPARRSLRNPAFRSVEFFADTLWPGTLPDALPIQVADKAAPEPLKKAILKVWEWSNWGSQKQVAVRWLAQLGDLFLKAVRRDDATGAPERVYLQLIDPAHVSDFDKDERGHLVYVRLDIPQTERQPDGKRKGYVHTEVWDKTLGSYRVWRHEKGLDEELDRLGSPTREQALADFGIDFVPFVHAKFRDLGEARGTGAYLLCLDKIDEANLMATRLHQMLFRYNKAVWALRANAMDPSGRPMPPPRIGDSDGTKASDTLTLGDDEIYRLPGTSELQAMVPPINYADALVILNAHLLDLEKDLPELVYYRLPDMGEVSGRAVRLMMSAAVTRALEARGNAEDALRRANMMALTLGVMAGLPDFANIGAFEAGDFEHSFGKRDVIEVDDNERAETIQKKYQAVQAGFAADVPAEYILEHDFNTPPDQLKDFDKAQKAMIEMQQQDAQPSPLEVAARTQPQGAQNGNSPRPVGAANQPQ